MLDVGVSKWHERVVIGVQTSYRGGIQWPQQALRWWYGRGQLRQRLPPSPDFHEPIRLFRIFHCGQQLLRLTMNTIHELLVAIGHPVTLQDRFAQPAQHASLDRLKSHPEDEQSRSLPDDFILENKIFWLEGMFGKVIFQLEERMKPLAAAGKDRRPFRQDGEGGCLLCRHGFELHVIARPTHGDTDTPKACSSWLG